MEKIVKIMASSPRLVDEKERIVRFRGTNATIDRDGESIDPKGWNFDNYMKNPVVQFGHNYGERPIARTVKLESDGDNIDFYVQFPKSPDEVGEDWFSFTDSIFRMSKSGFLNATSVGFRPTTKPKIEPKGDGIQVPWRRFVGQELLELSIVPVPSNPDALANAFENGVVKSCDIESIKRIITNETKDTKNVKWAEAIDEIINDNGEREDEDVKEVIDAIKALADLVGNLNDKVDELKMATDGVIKTVNVVNLPEMSLRVIKSHIDSAVDELSSSKAKHVPGDPETVEELEYSAEDIAQAILGSS